MKNSEEIMTPMELLQKRGAAIIVLACIANADAPLAMSDVFRVIGKLGVPHSSIANQIETLHAEGIIGTGNDKFVRGKPVQTYCVTEAGRTFLRECSKLLHDLAEQMGH